MEKEFKAFCARIKASRVGVPSRRAYPDDMKIEILDWVDRLSGVRVADGIGVSSNAIRSWRNARLVSASTADDPTLVVNSPNVHEPVAFNVTRISVENPVSLLPASARVVARLSRGKTIVDFFDVDALLRVLERGDA